MATRYIGITDFLTPTHSLRTAEYFAKCAKGLDRKLMVGIMMSQKTLNGALTKWAGIFPANEDIARIFVKHPVVFNTLHYADYEGVDVAVNLRKARALGGPELHAMQLDMIWPDAGMLHDFCAERPGEELVLQVNAPALEQVGNSPERLVEKLAAYEDCVDTVLLDMSMGRGELLQPERLNGYLHVLAEEMPRLGLAVAGGLGPSTMDIIDPLVARFPQLSWDAQSRLRRSGSALDPIDWDMAHAYIEKSCALLQDTDFHHYP